MKTLPQVGQTVLNYINGNWTASESDRWTKRYDPADQTAFIAEAPDSTRDDARQAVKAAHQARVKVRKSRDNIRSRINADLFQRFITMHDGHVRHGCSRT